MRIPILLTFVALALAGCNANQAINPSGQANLCASDPTCNPYNDVRADKTIETTFPRLALYSSCRAPCQAA